MMESKKDQSYLGIALSAAVPLHIMSMKANGVMDLGLDRARLNALCDELGEHGDLLLYKGGKPGQTAHLFNELAWGIAVLAFCPGGVTVFGQHYEASIEQQEEEL